MLIDAEVRREALGPQHSFIMEAPAGSGKTEVLVCRILSLLLTLPHPRHILAITFTRKAAAEMKARVMEALKSQLSDASEKSLLIQRVKAHIQEQRWTEEDLDSLSVMTIDALCARILNQEGRLVPRDLKIIPHYSVLGDPLMFALLDHLESQDDYAEALRKIFLYFGNNIERVKHLLLQILSQRAEWLSVFVPRKEQALAVQEELKSSVKSLYRLAWEKWKRLEPRSWAEDLHTWLNLPERNTEEALESIKKLPQALLTKQGQLRKRFDASLGLPPHFKADFQDFVRSLAESDHAEAWKNLLSEMDALPPLEVEISPLLEALIHILPLAAAHWQVLLQEHHYRDFQEEALQAVLTLSSSDPVSSALLHFERELKHILVDEFQDTSRLQFRLLELLTQTWMPGDGRTLFLVGDPMQSIYRFRDAKVELFLEAKAKGIAQVKLKSLQLRANFRTDERVLDFINPVLTGIFPKNADLLTGAVPFTPSISYRHYESFCGVETFHFKSVEEEAEALSQKIKQLLDADPKAQIGILARSRTHVKTLMHQLMNDHIPLCAEAWSNLSEAPILLDLISLTLALTHLGDRLSWLAVLRSPLVGLKADQLLEIAQKSQDKTLWEVLLEKKTEAPFQEFINIVESLIFNPNLHVVSKLKQAFVALTQGRFSFSKLEHAMIDQYEQFLSTYPLILSRQTFLEDLERQKLNIQEEGARVSVLTIHQAKGLEFDHVFLPNLNQGVRREDAPLMRWEELHDQGQFKLLLGLHKSSDGEEDPVYEYLSWLAHQEQANEQVRLLYVALTRAKKNLYLSHVMDETWSVKAGSFLKLLNLGVSEI